MVVLLPFVTLSLHQASSQNMNTVSVAAFSAQNVLYVRNAFLGALAKLRKVTVSLVMSVSAHATTWLPLDGF